MKNGQILTAWVLGMGLILALGWVLGLGSVSGARAAGPWYVAPGGNDEYACTTPGTACATINGALNKSGFVAGDIIHSPVRPSNPRQSQSDGPVRKTPFFEPRG